MRIIFMPSTRGRNYAHTTTTTHNHKTHTSRRTPTPERAGWGLWCPQLTKIHHHAHQSPTQKNPHKHPHHTSNNHTPTPLGTTTQKNVPTPPIPPTLHSTHNTHTPVAQQTHNQHNRGWGGGGVGVGVLLSTQTRVTNKQHQPHNHQQQKTVVCPTHNTPQTAALCPPHTKQHKHQGPEDPCLVTIWPLASGVAEAGARARREARCLIRGNGRELQSFQFKSMRRRHPMGLATDGHQWLPRVCAWGWHAVLAKSTHTTHTWITRIHWITTHDYAQTCPPKQHTKQPDPPWSLCGPGWGFGGLADWRWQTRQKTFFRIFAARNGARVGPGRGGGGQLRGWRGAVGVGRSRKALNSPTLLH